MRPGSTKSHAPCCGKTFDRVPSPRGEPLHPRALRAVWRQSLSWVAPVSARSSRRACASRGSDGCSASSRAIRTRSLATISRRAVRSRATPSAAARRSRPSRCSIVHPRSGRAAKNVRISDHRILRAAATAALRPNQPAGAEPAAGAAAPRPGHGPRFLTRPAHLTGPGPRLVVVG